MSAVAGKSSDKKSLYVGGLAEEVTEPILQAAFVPFGELREVVLPLDPASMKNRGFAFVEFEDADDAFHAMDNMNNAEFYGKVLRINYSRPSAMAKNRALWDNEEYMKKDVPDALEGSRADRCEYGNSFYDYEGREVYHAADRFRKQTVFALLKSYLFL